MGKRGLLTGLAVSACLLSAPALAYVGPGAGLSLLSALWGLLVAVGAALGFVVMWPIRRWRRRRKAAMNNTDTGTETEREEAEQPASATPPKRAAERNGHGR